MFFRNEDIAKGVLVSGTHIEPRSVYAHNETTFLVTYSSEILNEDIGSSIEKIDKWLGKPLVITCDEVTVTQLPQILEHVHHTTGVESVVFNTRLDEMRTESNPNICSGYHSYAGGPAVLGASGTTFLKKYQAYHASLVQNKRKTLRFEQWLNTFLDARKNFNEQLVRAAIDKSCVRDAADAICCLPPSATLDDIIKKFKWLYGSVESFDTLMQEFYQIVQGKSEKVQTFVLHLEWDFDTSFFYNLKVFSIVQFCGSSII